LPPRPRWSSSTATTTTSHRRFVCPEVSASKESNQPQSRRRRTSKGSHRPQPRRRRTLTQATRARTR
jgi:hypothetical protein